MSERIRHDLKVRPSLSPHVVSGDKTFEIRRDDRCFQRGEVLRLFEWDEAWGAPGPGVLIELRLITFVLRGGQYGLEPGFVALGLAAYP